MDEKYKSDLKMTTITIAISVAAALMGIIGFAISAIHGKISWVGIIVSVAMIINIIPAIKRRKEIKSCMEQQGKRL